MTTILSCPVWAIKWRRLAKTSMRFLIQWGQPASLPRHVGIFFWSGIKKQKDRILNRTNYSSFSIKCSVRDFNASTLTNWPRKSVAINLAWASQNLSYKRHLQWISVQLRWASNPIFQLITLRFSKDTSQAVQRMEKRDSHRPGVNRWKWKTQTARKRRSSWQWNQRTFTKRINQRCQTWIYSISCLRVLAKTVMVQ